MSSGFGIHESTYRPSVSQGAGSFTAGKWSYWAPDVRIIAWKPEDSVSIGAYCSIAGGVQLLAGGNHNVNHISTFPFSLMRQPPAPGTEVQPVGHVMIGDDVWIGANAIVVDASVGNGAVIGAGAVVVRDVPPYAVAVGSPAKVVRYRFSEAEISELEHLRWWDWPDEAVREAEPLLRSRDVAALVGFARDRGLVGGSAV